MHISKGGRAHTNESRWALFRIDRKRREQPAQAWAALFLISLFFGMPLEQMDENFAQSRPFKQIEGAIQNNDLFLQRFGDPL